MLLKILLVVLLIASLVYLLTALRYLVGNKTEDRVMLQKQLAKRFILCLCAFSILMLAFFKGYIQPHNIS